VVAELSKGELGEQPDGTLLPVAGQGGPEGRVGADGVGKRWRMSHRVPSRQRYDKPGQWHPSRVLRGTDGGPGSRLSRQSACRPTLRVPRLRMPGREEVVGPQAVVSDMPMSLTAAADRGAYHCRPPPAGGFQDEAPEGGPDCRRWARNWANWRSPCRSSRGATEPAGGATAAPSVSRRATAAWLPSGKRTRTSGFAPCRMQPTGSRCPRRG